MRLDQWLWAVRIYKTRSLATAAIRGGHVKVNGAAAKPAREVKPDDRIIARNDAFLRTLRVIDSPPSRVGAKLVAQFAEDIIPPEPLQRAPGAGASPLVRDFGSGRPTKRDRRRLDDFREDE